MNSITIGRFSDDPSAQGVIRPADDSWQLVIDAAGYPHLYVRVNVGSGQTGMFCIEDMLPDDLSIPDLMQGEFGEEPSEEDAAKAHEEFQRKIAEQKRPCPKP